MASLLLNLLRLVPLVAKLVEYIEQTLRERAALKRKDEKDAAVDAAVADVNRLRDNPPGQQPASPETPAVPGGGDSRTGVHS